MKLLKKYYVVCSVVVAVLLALAIFNNVSQSSFNRVPDAIKKVDLPQILERDTLNIVLGYNSLNYFIYKGTPMGYQYEMVSNLAKDFGLTPKIHISNDLETAFRNVAFGDCDLVAMDVSVANDRYPQISFTESFYSLRAVLVQQKDGSIITDLKKLNGKKVYVPKRSHYVKQLKDIEDSLKIDISVIEVSQLDSEDLIRLLASGKINYTICDENLAMVNAAYYSNLDYSVEIFEPYPMAWVVNINSTQWLDTLNSWLHNFKQSSMFTFLKTKYFNNPLLGKRVEQDYHSLSGNKLSPFDKYIKKYAKEIGWDWRLVASLIYQESRFEDNYTSYSGAFGIMQLMPVTAAKFGVFANSNIETQIKGGCGLLHHLDSTFAEYMPNTAERQRLVIGAYNLGESHFFDAFALGKKYNSNTQTWKGLLKCLKMKSKSKYYTDSVVKYGYCNPWYVEIFVEDVFERFEHYKNIYTNKAR